MSIQINGNNVIDNNRKGIFQSANVGTFANPARPTNATTGDLIYSTTDSELQVWDGSAWISAFKGKEIVATGGTISTTNGVRTHTFTSPGTFTIVSSPPTAVISYAVVAGGGGGGFSTPPGPQSSVGGGGGGGGGVLRGTIAATPGNYPVTVGAGGAGGSSVPGFTWISSTSGSPSSFGANTATGGGGGGNTDPGAPLPQRAGGPGGSGGAGIPGGAGTPGQGFSGSPGSPTNGGGGGGAGSSGIRIQITLGTDISIRGAATTLGPTIIPTNNYSGGGGQPSPSLSFGTLSSDGPNTGTGGYGNVGSFFGSGYSGDSGVVIVSYSIVQQ